MSVEFHIKARDAHQMLADAHNEEIEKLAPPEVKTEQERPSWDPAKIPWKEAEGTKGKYERYPTEGEKPKSTPDYKNLLADLKAHGGKLTRDNYFVWLFTDNATIGRKRRSF